jgi:VanZ family protein
MRHWLTVVLWMGFIFVGSTDVLSSRNTSRVLVPLLRWLNPGIRPHTIYRVQLAVRKAGHVAEYAVLAVLVLRAITPPDALGQRTWSWKLAAAALALAVLYATTDEFHQTFVSSRTGSARDVAFDTAGACLGLGCSYALALLRRRT